MAVAAYLLAFSATELGEPSMPPWMAWGGLALGLCLTVLAMAPPDDRGQS